MTDQLNNESYRAGRFAFNDAAKVDRAAAIKLGVGGREELAMDKLCPYHKKNDRRKSWYQGWLDARRLEIFGW